MVIGSNGSGNVVGASDNGKDPMLQTIEQLINVIMLEDHSNNNPSAATVFQQSSYSIENGNVGVSKIIRKFELYNYNIVDNIPVNEQARQRNYDYLHLTFSTYDTFSASMSLN